MKIITGGVTAAKGFQAASIAAGIKYQGRTDMAMVYSEKPCVAAGTFVCDRGDKTISYCDKSKSLVYFLLKVLGKLQEIGTVPAIDYNAYAQKIEVHQHP